MEDQPEEFFLEDYRNEDERAKERTELTLWKER